jgi:anti-anti-sigma factor
MALIVSDEIISRPRLRALEGSGRTVVWMRGEHDIATVDALSETMARAIALDDADLLVDLSDVEFMGAATVGVLSRTREYLRSKSRSMTLRRPSPIARRLLEVSGLASLIETST